LVISVDISRMVLALLSGFVVSIICVLSIWRLLPRLLGMRVYELIAQNKKGAGYYYVYAGLVTAGTVIFSIQFGGELALAFEIAEAFSRFLFATIFSLVGVAISIAISFATLRICDRATTQVREWDLIKSGNEAAGLYFIGAGLVVFSVLLAASWFPRI
jgi:hypothetical protein